MLKPSVEFLLELRDNYLEHGDTQDVPLPRSDSVMEPRYIEWLEANGYAVKGPSRIGGVFVNLTPDGVAFLESVQED